MEQSWPITRTLSAPPPSVLHRPAYQLGQNAGIHVCQAFDVQASGAGRMRPEAGEQFVVPVESAGQIKRQSLFPGESVFRVLFSAMVHPGRNAARAAPPGGSAALADDSTQFWYEPR